ncbi:MAG: cytochrome-c peroxidase, partial [Planctomycetota bacterium]|nr:cytochrome-c peroxidase [Planctomycetota bacterium]
MVILLTAGFAGAASAAENEVLLGGSELTSGIPGSGALTIAEVRSWLSKPENHETLKVQVPMGLDKGAAGIVIPEDNPLTRAKIELGRQLYFDARLSRDGTVSCASCHHPDKGYAFDTQFGVGVQGQEGGRNSPVSYNRILSGPQFWDGRADSLEAQAVGPIANPIEMGFTHDECVERLKTIEGYRLQFEKIFPDGGVTIDNVGKAIASFERVVVTGPSPADYYEPVLLVESQFPELVKDLEAFEEEDPDSFDFYMEAVE